MAQENKIRNFVITAHIDHGKSTLADRMLEITETVDARKMHEQYLDTMGLEQERGITIKMQPVTMRYTQQSETLNTKSDLSDRSQANAGILNKSKIQNTNNEKSQDLGFRDSNLEFDSTYMLNLIDTPGHVDFGYEVSRALAAVEGAILLVDASKGVQAQTVANLELAQLLDLKIIPVINKIDLPQARPEEVKEEIASILGIEASEVASISAKDGTGVEELLVRVIKEVPPPELHKEAPLRALVFDSHYDDYRGVIAHVRVVDGSINRLDRIELLATGARAEALEVGRFSPELKPQESLNAGAIGYIATGLKTPDLVRIGDTIVSRGGHKLEALSGYEEPKPVVYAALFPEDADDYDALKDALDKLRLNDAALVVRPEESHVLGRGYRCGFLGTLHIEIIVERLEREFGLTLVVTHPSVAITAKLPNGDTIDVKTPRDFPNQSVTLLEPWVKLEVIAPSEKLNAVVKAIVGTRGTIEATDSVTKSRLLVKAAIPLLDVVEDFADRLKSATSGYASFSWVPYGERVGDLVKLDVLVAHEEVEALSKIVPRVRSEREARQIAKKLKEILPAQLFSVAIQVALGGRVVARETIRALRKDVTAGLYGGDFTRKKKLLVKQRKGKKRLEKDGKVKIPADVFVKLLKR